GRRPDLHLRIEAFGRLENRKWAEAAGYMLAAKYIGNAATHSDPLERSDVLDVFDMLEVVLEDLFVGRQRAIRAMASAINDRKGPRSAGAEG
ncbi:MAG: hypothetical protein ACK4S3_07430, partial [Parvibaculum sp.]